MAQLRLENAAKDFSDGRQLRRVLHNTSLVVDSGELVVISGPSGSGKTTLLSLMGLVLKLSEGKIFLNDRDITGVSDNQAANIRLLNYGFVFQQPMLIEGLSVMENILLSLAIQGKSPTTAEQTRAEGLLQNLGLKDVGHFQPRLLSGGMKQRASIARALIKDPAILLCDEPTSALDAESGQGVMAILKRIAIEDRRIVCVVSHDARVFPFADRLIKVENGRIAADNRERYSTRKDTVQ